MSELQTVTPGFLSDIRNIIMEARSDAIRSVEYVYRLYPIANALRSQLNWHKYRLLIRIDVLDLAEGGGIDG